jgi:hypothetical protein
MASTNSRSERYPKREFRRVETEFSLDAGHQPMRSGSRPLWRINQEGADPILVGMCELTLVGQDSILPGETSKASWYFDPGVQGYIEQLVKPGDQIEVCEATGRIGSARVLGFVY